MNLKFKLFINDYLLAGSFDLNKSDLILIKGANGVGKTSLFDYLRQNYSHFSFADQRALSPVGEYFVEDVFCCLEEELKERVPCPIRDFSYYKQFNLQRLMKKKVSHLSGGENQLIKIVIAFYIAEKFIFLDEPFHFLDAVNKELLIKIIKEQRQQGKGFVVIEHSDDLDDLASIKYKIEKNEENLIFKKESDV